MPKIIAPYVPGKLRILSETSQGSIRSAFDFPRFEFYTCGRSYMRMSSFSLGMSTFWLSMMSTHNPHTLIFCPVAHREGRGGGSSLMWTVPHSVDILVKRNTELKTPLRAAHLSGPSNMRRHSVRKKRWQKFQHIPIVAKGETATNAQCSRGQKQNVV